MSYVNASIKKIFFAEKYGNRGRTFSPIEYVLRTSMAGPALNLKAPSGATGTIGDGTFLFASGKQRKVQISYFPLDCDVEGDSSQKLCDNPDKVSKPVQREFEITQKTTTQSRGINAEDIRLTDNNTWDFSGVALETIGAMMPAARKLLAEDLTTYLLTKAGHHSDGNPTKQVPPAYTTAGVVNPFGGRITIEKEYMDAGMDSPYIMGGDQAFYLKYLTGLGGAQNTGIQTNQINTENIWYDDNIMQNIKGDLTNGGWMIAIDPAIFKFVTYSNNAGLFRTDRATLDNNTLEQIYKSGGGEDFILGVFTDPKTGLIWDMYLNFNKCAEWNDGNPGWTVFLRLEWDMLVMPPTNCNIPEYNGITLWRTCPEKVAACPEGNTPSPAITPSTFEWTPGSIYPLTAYQSLVGGDAVSQNEPVEIANIAALASFLNDVTGNVYGFVVNGSDIEYEGVVGIDVNINNGEVTGTFS